MTSSLPIVLTKEDILTNLDGAAGLSLYDLVEQTDDWKQLCSHELPLGYVNVVFECLGEFGKLRYEHCHRAGTSGIPKHQSIKLRVPDRTCGGSYEYEAWGTKEVRFQGKTIFDGFVTSDFGYPHPFQLTPIRRWEWNIFYHQRIADAQQRRTMLDREPTGEIWRTLMLLAVSLDRSNSSLQIVKNRAEASERLAVMAHDSNTYWGD